MHYNDSLEPTTAGELPWPVLSMDIDPIQVENGGDIEYCKGEDTSQV